MKKKIYFAIFTILLVIASLIWVNGDLFAQDKDEEKSAAEVPENIPFIDADGDGINDLLQYGWGLRFLQRYKRRQAVEEGLSQGGVPRGPLMIDTDNDGKGDTPMYDYIHDSEGNLIEDKLDELIDTDGDGEADTAIKDLIMLGRGWKRGLEPDFMPGGSIMIDTDDDGEGDTPLYQYLRDLEGEIDTGKLDELIDTDGDGEVDTAIKDLMRRRFGTFDSNGDGRPDIGTTEEIRQHMQELQTWRHQMIQRIKDGLPPVVDEDGDGIPDDLPGTLKMRWHGGRDTESDNK